MFSRSRLNIGLDIGQHAVHWAAIDPNGGKVKALWSGITSPTRQTKQDLLEGEALEKRLRELLATCQKEVATFPKAVFTSVQGTGTICGYLELPKLTPKELKTAVPSKLAKQLPFPIDEVILSHVNVPPLVADPQKCALVYIAVQKKIVEERSALMRRLGLELKGMEVPPIALARYVGKNHNFGADELVGIVQFGFQFTQVVISRQAFPYYHRQFATAGGEATYAMQMGTQSDWTTAESRKRDYDATGRMVAMEPFLTRWMSEVKRTLDSFHSRQGKDLAPLKSVVLSGGGAGWPGLAARLEEVVGVPVVVDAWKKIALELPVAAGRGGGAPEANTSAMDYSLAVGLALGE